MGEIDCYLITKNSCYNLFLIAYIFLHFLIAYILIAYIGFFYIQCLNPNQLQEQFLNPALKMKQYMGKEALAVFFCTQYSS